MIQKKICLIGAFAVGKTSLVQQYVNSLFSEKYLTTLGVKIDKKLTQVGDVDVKLLIWDLAGEDKFMKVRMSYLRGSSGFVFIVDGTRSETLNTIMKLDKQIASEIGELPSILIINKSDLKNEWQISKQMIADLSAKGWLIYQTSAKDGSQVDDAFQGLTKKMLEKSNG